MEASINPLGTTEQTKISPWQRRMITACLDALLLLLFLLLLSPRLTGLPIHEWIGLSLFIPLVIHLLLSWPWIATSTLSFRAASRRTTINYLLNWLLFILMMVEVVSGIAISQVVLPSFGILTIDDRSWRALHNLTLNWTLLTAGFHVAVNWKWIVVTARSWPTPWSALFPVRFRMAPTFAKGLSRIMIITVTASVVFAIVYLILGPPSPSRQYVYDEIARFRPTVGHGLGQFAGESFLLALVAYIGRRWLRLRL